MCVSLMEDESLTQQAVKVKLQRALKSMETQQADLGVNIQDGVHPAIMQKVTEAIIG